MGKVIRSARHSGDIAAMPAAELRRAIRSPEGGTPPDVLERLRTVLGLFWQPGDGPRAEAARLVEWDRALSRLPGWAVQRALDRWVVEGTRRPAPAEIIALARGEIAPIGAEIERRRKAEAARQADDEQAERRRHHAPEARSYRCAVAREALAAAGWAHLVAPDWLAGHDAAR